jgi:nicotinate-nucleotide adenylyltransferase
MIGIFGGTFDPVHWGHVRLASTVQQELALTEVRWVPLNQAVHKQQPIASAAQRLAMVQDVIRDNPVFSVDDCEYSRGGASFMVDTLADIQVRMPGKTLCLLIGADAFRHFADWKQPERILQLAHLVVVQRPGFLINPPPWLAKRCCTQVTDLHRQPAGLIYVQKIRLSAIASTAIRRVCAEQGDVQAVLPPQTIAYIQQKGLYQSEAR